MERSVITNIVSYVSVERFRSILSASVVFEDSFVPIVGTNSAGKSNLVSALRLFFTGRVHDFSELDFDSDYCGMAHPGARRRIRIQVGLAIEAFRGVPDLRKFAAEHKLGPILHIVRTWKFSAEGEVEESIAWRRATHGRFETPSTWEVRVLRSVLRSVRFRHVRFYSQPADEIGAIMNELQPLLLSQFRTRSEPGGRLEAANATIAYDALSEHLNRTSERMFGGINEVVGKAFPDLNLRPRIPSSLEELAVYVDMTAFRQGEIGRGLESEGSGVQSFVLLHFLALSDRLLMQDRGKSARVSLWALEEPESFCILRSVVDSRTS